MMSETISKIKEKKDKFKERVKELDTLFGLGDYSSDNKNNKKEKN
tara:strand:- start:350 stop:484 length:135 start_codon:yes stop_codon:yes gene_type:complete